MAIRLCGYGETYSSRHECVSAAARTRHRPRPSLVLAARFPGMPGRVECDVCPQQLTAVECRPPLALVRWQRVDAVPDHLAPLHPGHQGLGAVLARPSPVLRLYDQLEPSPGVGDLLREIDRPDRDLLGTGPSRLRRPHSAGT
jgi:hypothetical protein